MIECFRTKFTSLSIAVVFIFLAGYYQVVLPAQNGYGILVLQTGYNGLEVRIDGTLVGKTPVSPFALPAGDHRLLVSHPDRGSWMARDWVRDISIAEDDTLSQDVVFTLYYAIRSEPFGAKVMVEDRAAGETPLYYSLLEDKIEQVTLTKPGFHDTTFTVGGNGRKTFDIRLRQSSDSIKTGVQLTTEKIEKTTNKTPALYIGGALMLVSGAAAFYFKQQANDSYDQYLQTGNPDDLSGYYNDANSYDRLFRVSFAGFNASLVFTVYTLLK
jgi:hypothetical protein